MLEGTFIGAYKIVNPNATAPNNILELNSVTMDAALADDQLDPAGTAPPRTYNRAWQYQNIGRFCPVGNPQGSGAAQGDYQNPVFPANANAFRYQFAMRLFDYFAAQQNPSEDYTPNVPVDQGSYDGGLYTYPGYTTTGTTPVLAVPNGPGSTVITTAGSANPNVGAANGVYNAETTAPSHGLINLNTCSWKALVLRSVGSQWNRQQRTDWIATQNLAQKIVYFRDVDDGTGNSRGHGPFQEFV